MTTKALIIGAGIGGLSAAILLRSSGHDVHILEKAAQLGEVGAGIQLSPNAVHVLRSIGIANEVAKIAVEPNNISLRNFQTGKAELSLSVKNRFAQRYGAPYWHVHRSDLHAALLKAAMATGVKISTGQHVTHVSTSEPRAVAKTESSEHSADFIVGADGIHSVVRKAIEPKYNPEFTGQVAWRGLIPANENIDPNYS